MDQQHPRPLLRDGYDLLQRGCLHHFDVGLAKALAPLVLYRASIVFNTALPSASVGREPRGKIPNVVRTWNVTGFNSTGVPSALVSRAVTTSADGRSGRG